MSADRPAPDGAPVPAPIPSATVMLVRDRPRFEILMVKRHHQIDFASGALVFPGGKIDRGDRDGAWADHADGWTDLDPDSRERRICAAREAFEESGILLATARDGESGAALAERSVGLRDDVAAARLPFLDAVAQVGARLDLPAMRVFSRWITPVGMPKRFDTTFFLMTAPADQTAACDGHETVDAEWIAPGDALALARSGARTLVFPTRLNLQLLAESRDVDDALAAAGRRPPSTILPTLSRDENGRSLVGIGPDAGYGHVPPQPF